VVNKKSKAESKAESINYMLDNGLDVDDALLDSPAKDEGKILNENEKTKSTAAISTKELAAILNNSQSDSSSE
jgi:hypothetical protein